MSLYISRTYLALRQKAPEECHCEVLSGKHEGVHGAGHIQLLAADRPVEQPGHNDASQQQLSAFLEAGQQETHAQRPAAGRAQLEELVEPERLHVAIVLPHVDEDNVAKEIAQLVRRFSLQQFEDAH